MLSNCKCIGADSTGATGTFAPVLSKVLWREYGFAPVLFEPSKNEILLRTRSSDRHNKYMKLKMQSFNLFNLCNFAFYAGRAH